jgi:hypothetical protein
MINSNKNLTLQSLASLEKEHFTPTEEYESIKKQVQEFCTSTKKDFEKWYSLRFNVQIENGYFIFLVPSTDKLYTAGSPNNGILTEVGALGINVDVNNGFDIGGTDNNS